MRHKKIRCFLFFTFFVLQPVSMQAMEYLRTARNYTRHAALVGAVFAIEYWQQASAATYDVGCKSYTYTDCSLPITAYKDSDANFVINSVSGKECEWVCNDTPLSCFSGDDTVEIFNGKENLTISMSELQVGHRVRVGTRGDDAIRYEEVSDFLHRDPEKSARFVRLHLKGVPIPLFLTENHMVQRAADSLTQYDPDTQTGWLPSRDLHVRDRIFYHGKPKQIDKITVMEKTGIYAPLTDTTGTLEVNGVGCSCFIELPGLTPDQSHTWGKMYAQTIRRKLTRPMMPGIEKRPVSYLDILFSSLLPAQ